MINNLVLFNAVMRAIFMPEFKDAWDAASFEDRLNCVDRCKLNEIKVRIDDRLEFYRTFSHELTEAEAVDVAQAVALAVWFS